MATVKSLSQMMLPGIVGANGDCETCGPSSTTSVVTRPIAKANLEKINAGVKKADAAPVEAAPDKPKPLLSPNKPVPPQIAAKKPINEY